MKQIQATCVKTALWFSIEGVQLALRMGEEKSRKINKLLGTAKRRRSFKLEKIN